MSNVTKFLREIKARDCNLTKIRIGNKRDGGYVALKELCEKTGVVYSFGVGDDIGFELDFVDRFPQVREIRLFDPTINYLPIVHPKFIFNRVGVGRGLNALNTLCRRETDNAMLKMDIEWNEWEVLQYASDETLQAYDQILIEFHIVKIDDVVAENYTAYFQDFMTSVYDKINQRLFHMYLEIIRKLKRLFYIYHVHANNSLAKVCAGGHSFPPLIELSLVRKDLVKGVHETTSGFPVEGLDYPNKSDREDITNFYPLGE